MTQRSTSHAASAKRNFEERTDCEQLEYRMYWRAMSLPRCSIRRNTGVGSFSLQMESHRCAIRKQLDPEAWRAVLLAFGEHFPELLNNGVPPE